MPSRLTIIKLSCRSRWRSQKTNRITREVLRRARRQTLEKRAPLNEVSPILALLIFKGIVSLPHSGNLAFTVNHPSSPSCLWLDVGAVSVSCPMRKKIKNHSSTDHHCHRQARSRISFEPQNQSSRLLCMGNSSGDETDSSVILARALVVHAWC